MLQPMVRPMVLIELMKSTMGRKCMPSLERKDGQINGYACNYRLVCQKWIAF